ncbi:hypothetical protein CMQ_4863 [Grosmannia clavigera kw1407]|uniref:Myb-like DNA-binding domain-containing protein n=1 Tax=Grosmannia clavigera (strain kw1407 / UAMH 11150) TaxID=655863 RepID=F0XTG2_GROCL|nr:uncharacterized protein CMQ_4863 [Grosmannia clavigera kw1407]EFW99011.1 hypothetical protein CMQ_4863 [Grosmannia clavigera kw1407]
MGSVSAGGGNAGCNSSNGSSGTDKAIARLLYAMLRQKSLKDIDWDQVARDPALLEEISNGHAARMRFSRFRTTVENQGKPRRSRLSGGSTSSNVSAVSTSSITSFKVMKPKRDVKDKCRDASGQRGLPKWIRDADVKMEEIQGADRDDGEQDDQPAERKDGMKTALSLLPLSPPRENLSGISRLKRRKTYVPSIARMQSQQVLHSSPSQTQLPFFVSGHSGYDSHALVRNPSSSSAPELPSQLRMRHLTPCSDADQATAMTAADVFDFNTATAAAASIAAAHYSSSGSYETAWMTGPSHHSHPQQLPSPFSPSLGDFGIAAPMDPSGVTASHFYQASLQQEQPHQSSICLPGYAMEHHSMAPQAYSRHCIEWNASPGHVNNHDSQCHSQLHTM